MDKLSEMMKGAQGLLTSAAITTAALLSVVSNVRELIQFFEDMINF